MPTFAGKHVRFNDLIFAPKPVAKPHPPIWIGGESGVALRRTVRVGDGWYPAIRYPCVFLVVRLVLLSPAPRRSRRRLDDVGSRGVAQTPAATIWDRR